MMRPAVIVAGYLVRGPLAGYAWQALHYLLGLRALGYEPYFYEDNGDYGLCYDPSRNQMVQSPAYGCAFTERALARVGLGGRWVFRDFATGETHGMAAGAWQQVLRDAAFGLDLGGVNRGFPPDEWTDRPTIYVDLDPGVTQLTLAQGTPPRRDLARYTLLATLGESIGTALSPVPCGDFRWHATRPPVVLELWEPRDAADDARVRAAAGAFTTVGHWNSGGSDLVIDGEAYSWRKRLEFMRVLELPRRTGQRFHLAMDVSSVLGDAETMAAHGWTWTDPLAVSMDLDRYHDFVAASLGEFSVAKDLVIRWRVGWFSDRSACYLAAGRPVVMQETGFSEHIPTGEGLLAFTNLDQAVAAVEAVVSDYARHARAARDLAAAYFDAAGVLRRLLGGAGLGG